MVRVAPCGGALGLGVLQRHVVAAAVAGAHAGHRGQRHHLGALLLGEVEVVLHQGVLRVVLAAGHAVAAGHARGALGPGAPEVGVGDVVALLVLRPAEEDPDRRRVEGVAHPEVGGDLLHDVVGRGAQRVLDHAEHPLGLVVVRRQLALPVGDAAPLRVAVERLEGLVERVGVDQGAAADARAGQDQRVAHGVDALDAVAADLRAVEELLEVEAGLGEVAVLEPGARLDHRDLVALLDQAQRAHRATEARSDDDHVVVVGHQALPSFFIRRRLTVITFA